MYTYVITNVHVSAFNIVSILNIPNEYNRFDIYLHFSEDSRFQNALVKKVIFELLAIATSNLK